MIMKGGGEVENAGKVNHERKPRDWTRKTENIWEY